MKFYKVVFSIEKKPGRTSLKSYSLIYWDASGWKTIDKIWKTRVWETL